MIDPAALEDPLGEMLGALQVTATQVALADLGSPWGIACGPFAPAMLYVSLEGDFILQGEGASPIFVQQGDIAIVTRPMPVRIMSEPDAPVIALDEIWGRRGLPTWARGRRPDRVARLSFGGDGPRTRQVSIVVELSQSWAVTMLESLPPVIHVKAGETSVQSWLEALLASIQSGEPGYSGIALRLADLVFVSALRAFFLVQRDKFSGWLRAISDPHLSRAVTAVQRMPGHSWTVDKLSREAGLSRSAFCKRFGGVVGESPHAFVSAWRTSLAADWLTEQDMSAKEIAARLGFSTPSAFGQAFKRRYGVAPAQFARGRRGSAQR